MKLASALAKLKSLKNQLIRTESYITESMSYAADSTPLYNYKTEVETRGRLVNEIMDLKSLIAATNNTTKVNFNDQTLILNELILLNAQLRSELAYWAKIQKAIRVDTNPFRTTDTVKQVLAEGLDAQELKKKLLQLERTKEAVDACILQANLETELVKRNSPEKES